ncbi:hypothetical protein IFM89_028217 [Coptis chinensis]|uniref:Uncharacterized protein n=1 Tax=Coptis chinensis TaxID=261450 RepID=A0A835IQY9_9MAGN|nr:hypothetical protein IFM89_028217 [Coptis chinensis]
MLALLSSYPSNVVYFVPPLDIETHRIVKEEASGKRYVKLRLSTKALKTIEKNGLDAVAKKAGMDLRKE